MTAPHGLDALVLAARLAERTLIIARIRRMFKPSSQTSLVANTIADLLETPGPEEIKFMTGGNDDE